MTKSPWSSCHLVILSLFFVDRNLHDLLARRGWVLLWVAQRNRIHDILPLRYFAKDRIFAIQIIGRRSCDEELRATAVRLAGIGHGHDSRLIELHLVGELV